VPWGVDQVDQVPLLFGAILIDVAVGDIEIVLEVEGDTSRLNGDTSLLLVLTSVGASYETSSILGDNPGFCDKRVSQGRLSMVDVSNN
jgi:hypothetical protein